MPHFRRLSVLAAATLLPTAALAHTGSSAASSFGHGFAHPFSGFDHLLAMVTVGILAFQIGGRALCLVPASFVLVMAIGGAAGAAGIGLPFVETGIALSVIVLGAIVAFGIRPSVAAAAAMAGLFAIAHGHAHGAEIPAVAGAPTFAAGFMLATTLLHAAGIAIAFVMATLGDRFGPVAVRSAGGVAAIAGVALLAGA